MNKYTAKTLDDVLALASEKEGCPVSEINYKVIEEKNRCSAGHSVPACGLYFIEAEYPENILHT